MLLQATKTRFTLAKRRKYSPQRCCSSSSSIDAKRLHATARQFVSEEVLPIAAAHDKSGEFPMKLVQRAHELGLMNSDTLRKFGGLGITLEQKSRIYEAFGYGDLAFAASLMISELAQVPIIRANNPYLLEKYVHRMTREPILAAFATTEEKAGSDLANIQLSAVESNGEYELNGSKAWISNANEASWFFILARTNANAPQFTGFIVDRDARGLSVEPKIQTLGMRAASISTVRLDRVRVPATNIVGSTGDGFSLALYAFKRTRPLLAALGCGIQQRALDKATKYAKTRRAFGAAIIEHEGISFKIANMAQNLEASRLLAHQAAAKVDEDAPDAVYHSSIAKVFSAEAAFQAANEALQIFGGNGYDCAYGIEKLLRDSKSLALIGGSCEVQRRLIARQYSKRALET